MIEALEKVSLFKELSHLKLEAITPFCQLLNLMDGDMLIRESDKNVSDLYLLCAGSVEIVSSATAITSGEVVISKQDKDLFGEMGWLTNAPRTASVRCHGNVQAIRVDGQALSIFLDSHPDVGFIIMRHIA
ncbi:MAG TPA: cyclic nucleotide-binding domain-containing protein, partial [Candidatus Tenderia electrophaga]|nr:cyclic nucleotide-binding domain-containing protein [Candidatus Tenderia electrophaga]